jgi:hypothetical protein
VLDNFFHGREEQRLTSTQQNDPSCSQALGLLDDGDEFLRRQLPLQRLPGGRVTVGAAEVAFPGEFQLQGQQPLAGQALGDRRGRKPQLGIQLVIHADPP